MGYIFSEVLNAILNLVSRRMAAGFGATLLLEGPAGGGKTSFAKALTHRAGGKCYYYSGSPDKERDLLYEVDVDGVLRREKGWVPGPAWQAFEASQRGEFAVLLIDELDKTNPGFDAFLLRLLEEWTFRAPNGEEITADPTRVAVVLTSNGRRKLRPEVLRRCQRIPIPRPTGDRMKKIIRSIAGVRIPDGLLDLLVRVGDKVFDEEQDAAPSPKELALCAIDVLALAQMGEPNVEVWRTVAASYLTKDMRGPHHLDRLLNFKWAKALQTETGRLLLVA